MKKTKKVSLLDLKKKKDQPITMMTAYDYPGAIQVDESGVDMILVGDSLAMTVLGYPDTVSVTMEEMIHHCKAVARGTKRAFLVGDMPFLSYGIDPAETIRNAGVGPSLGCRCAPPRLGAGPPRLDRRSSRRSWRGANRAIPRHYRGRPPQRAHAAPCAAGARASPPTVRVECGRAAPNRRRRKSPCPRQPLVPAHRIPRRNRCLGVAVFLGRAARRDRSSRFAGTHRVG